MEKKIFLVFALSVLLLGCAPSRFVVPLEYKEQAVHVSLGGPVIDVPNLMALPIPLTAITYGNGVSEKLTVYGSVYPTALLFGTLQMDLGFTRMIWESDNENHGFTFSPAVNFAIDRFEFNGMFYPQLDAHYYWIYNRKYLSQDDIVTGKRNYPNFVYGGLGTWFELNSLRAHEENQPNVLLPNLQIGHEFVGAKWSFKTELRFIAPNLNNQNKVVKYKSLTGDFGATGVYFGVMKRF